MSLIAAQLMRKHTFATASEVEDTGTTIQYPSTAAFMVDSTDRVQPVGDVTSSGDFIISKSQALFNGFFKRIAVQEVVLDWGIPNIADHPVGNGGVIDMTTFSVIYDIGAGPVTKTIQLSQGFYNVKQCLDTIVSELNTTIGTPNFFQIDTTSSPPNVFLVLNQALNPGKTFTINSNNEEYNLPVSLFGARQVDTAPLVRYQLCSPDIRVYRYLDFTSPQLTYNQDLKDNTTAQFQRDVLYRWYFAYDNGPVPVDAYGFPIYQGYTPFQIRRLIAFPKQILWNKAQPIGTITFQVYNDEGDLIDPTAYNPIYGDAEMEFQMTFLLSEN